MDGWIKVHRDLLTRSIFKNEKLLKVFIWCLCKAYHKEFAQPIGRQIVQILPGQFPTGRFKAGEELDMKPSTAWDYLKILESNGTINIKSNSKYSIITLVNWNLYQLENKNPDSKTDSKSTTNQQQVNTNKNDKNEKKDIYTEDFEKFYSLYPNPTGKAQTFKNWKKVIKEHGPEVIIRSAERYKKSLKEDTEKMYITKSYNFLGQKAVFMDFLIDETEKSPKIDLNPKLNDFSKWK